MSTRPAVYAMAAAGFAAFAVWGSLFPFRFDAVPLARAISRLWAVWPLPLTTASVTDVFSNSVLFVPIGVFATAALESKWPPLASARAVVAAAVSLSVVLELGQALVAFRTPSVVDVVAECGGAIFGVVLWRRMRAVLERAADTVLARWRDSTAAERFFVAYGALFAIAWLFPFDFTIRPDEILNKYEHKRLLLPFSASPDAATSGELRIVLAAAVPLGVMAGFVVPATCLAALTVLQVTVFSRTTDATSLVWALAGAASGVIAAQLARTHLGARSSRRQ